MKVQMQMEFNIFQLFCHEWPYGLTVSESSLCWRLNEELRNMHSTDYRTVELLNMDDCGLHRWLLKVVMWEDKNDDGTMYPKERVHVVAGAKRAIPPPIRKMLEELNKRSFIFKQEEAEIKDSLIGGS